MLGVPPRAVTGPRASLSSPPGAGRSSTTTISKAPTAARPRRIGASALPRGNGQWSDVWSGQCATFVLHHRVSLADLARFLNGCPEPSVRVCQPPFTQRWIWSGGLAAVGPSAEKNSGDYSSDHETTSLSAQFSSSSYFEFLRLRKRGPCFTYDLSGRRRDAGSAPRSIHSHSDCYVVPTWVSVRGPVYREGHEHK